MEILAMASDDSAKIEKPTKLITFLGKGGSGKTTSAIFAAQVCQLSVQFCYKDSNFMFYSIFYKLLLFWLEIWGFVDSF